MTSWKNLVVALVAAFMLAACSSSSDNGTDASMPTEPTPDPAIAEREAISTAIMAAQTAVAAVDNDSTDAEVSAADNAIAAARAAIVDAADVPAAEKAAHTGTVNALAGRLAAAKTARQTAMNDDQRAADMAMAVLASKLYVGIGAPGGTGEDTRTAAYGTGDNADDIAVTIGDADAVNLSEDKDATVAANAGWKGKRYTRTMPAADGMYEAVVYSNVEASTRGRKFGSADPVTDTGAYEYQLTNEALTNAQLTADGAAARIVLSGVTRTAGTEMYNLPDSNPNGVSIINVSGSYHGVSGTYSCATTADTACTAAVAAEGFTLGGGTAGWTFRPSNADARVMDSADTIYASYGWWIHKAANDGGFTASAFVSDVGEVPNAAGITNLMGTATYTGGAAGKYALRSSTGGTNDAGHFTANATLEADFNDDMITGTINGFRGADGESRDWSVELMASGVGDTGIILGSDGTGDQMMTVWTIGETGGVASGGWQGTLQDNGDDNVPKVGTGTFYSTFGEAGKMVGAFGVNLQ